MNEYLDLLENEVGHFQSPSNEAFGHEMPHQVFRDSNFYFSN